MKAKKLSDFIKPLPSEPLNLTAPDMEKPTDKIEDFDVFHAMLKYGGSFVQALARAAQHADSTNLQRIKSTWPEYWREYSNMAFQHQHGKRKD